jgi:ParB family chromosome partitioning protein
MVEKGKDKDFILRVMKIDDTAFSRMKGAVETIPRSVIEAIGPARDSGRRPWEELRQLIRNPEKDEPILLRLVPTQEQSRREKLTSDDRLRRLIDGFRREVGRERRTSFSQKKYAGGKLILDRKGSALTLRAKSNGLQLFLDDLEAQFEDLYRKWEQRDKG